MSNKDEANIVRLASAIRNYETDVSKPAANADRAKLSEVSQVRELVVGQTYIKTSRVEPTSAESLALAIAETKSIMRATLRKAARHNVALGEQGREHIMDSSHNVSALGFIVVNVFVTRVE